MGILKRSITINAPKQKVWDVLTVDELNRQWYAEFSADTHAVTDWKVGSKVVFVDNTDSGIVGKITASDVSDLLAIEYTGMVQQGKEDYDSDLAKSMKGATEIYRISTENGLTHLEAECNMDDEFIDMMSSAWDKAIVKIKELAEA